MRKLLISLMLCVTTLLGCVQTVYADDVSAKSCIVIDYTTGEILFEKNAYEQMPMASTTKIMSALLSVESGSLDERFTVDSEAIKAEGSSMGLKEGDIVSKRILLYGMLLPSGNDAANATAVRVAGSVDNFVDMMNERAKELGMNSTHFVTPSGLDDDTDEHYSTSYDMALLTAKAMENGVFREICGVTNAKLCYGNPPYDRWLTNSNKLLSSCDGIIGVKTGFTDKARRCLVSACERDGATLICVTLNDPDDWQDHSRLYDICFEKMSEQALSDDVISLEADVVGGVENTVKCFSPVCKASLPNGMANQVTTVVSMKKFLYAPIAQREIVGQISYYYGDKLIAQCPVYTSLSMQGQPVAKQGIVSYYYDRIKELVE